MNDKANPINNTETPVRIDKWLWAARFFKTRSLAKQAIEGGKVHYNGQRVKSSKAVETGAELRIRIGWDEKTVTVTALSDRRRSAADAAHLYTETEASLALREQRQAERKATNAAFQGEWREKPNKKQRRQIHRFKRQVSSDNSEQ